MTCSRHIQGDTQAVAQLLLRSLLHLQAHPEQHSSAVKHLLLELLPTSIPTTSPDLRSLALQLFTSYRNPVDAKLSVKVASAFQLTVEDVSPQWGELEAFVADLLQDRSNYTAAVRLMLLFEVCVGGWEGGGVHALMAIVGGCMRGPRGRVSVDLLMGPPCHMKPLLLVGPCQPLSSWSVLADRSFHTNPLVLWQGVVSTLDPKRDQQRLPGVLAAADSGPGCWRGQGQHTGHVGGGGAGGAGGEVGGHTGQGLAGGSGTGVWEGGVWWGLGWCFVVWKRGKKIGCG